MKALVHDRYGDVDGLEIRDLPHPTAGDAEVVVRIEAAALNMADWHMMTGLPMFMRLFVGLRKPPRPVPGTDFAGVVEAVGPGVTDLAVGDEVFGATPGGACAEFVSAPAERILARPAGLSAEEAACLGVAPITALQGLRDKCAVKPGDHVLIIGASGGVGTYAIQVAKHLGAMVTAVCSTGNVDQARELGADIVVDYRTDDFVQLAREASVEYDVIFDNPGNRTLRDLRSVMKRNGRYVMVGGPKGKYAAAIPRMLAGMVTWKFFSQEFVGLLADETRADLLVLRDLTASGAIRSVISDRYPLDEAASAMAQQGAGHAQAKIVVTM